MTGEELEGRFRRLGLSKADVARRLGVSWTTVWRWIVGRVPVPGYVVAWLEEIERTREKKEEKHDDTA